LSYRYAVHHTLKVLSISRATAPLGAASPGATGLFTDTTARAKLAAPGVVEFGVRKTVDVRWTVLLEVDWTGWRCSTNCVS
jgi:long-subunit fatty acid transport protein